MKIKIGDQVQIIAGKDNGKTGAIIAISKKRNQVKVEKLNMRIKHIKKRNNQPGEKIEYEAYFDASNVMLLDPKTNKPSRVKYNILADGSKERVTVKAGNSLDAGKKFQKTVKTIKA